jgi:hypothetical protein
MLQGEENDSCCTPPDVAKAANSAALNLLSLMSMKMYEKAYGSRAEKCYFTPANSVLNSYFIFVLSAQKDCFLLAHENEFSVETVRSRLQTHSNASKKTIILRTKYKHYFFYNRFLNLC